MFIPDNKVAKKDIEFVAWALTQKTTLNVIDILCNCPCAYALYEQVAISENFRNKSGFRWR